MMERKYKVVTAEAAKAMKGAFASQDEFDQFSSLLNDFLTVAIQMSLRRNMMECDQETIDNMDNTRIFIFAEIVRSNMELVRDLVKLANPETVTREELPSTLNMDKSKIDTLFIEEDLEDDEEDE